MSRLTILFGIFILFNSSIEYKVKLEGETASVQTTSVANLLGEKQQPFALLPILEMTYSSNDLEEYFPKKDSSLEISINEIKNKKELNEISQDTLFSINAEIDTVSVKEIKNTRKEELPTIFDYYKIEVEDEVAIWSNKMFGRCCTEADLLYTELLSFNISTNFNNENYPIENLSDTKYRTAFTFKEKQKAEIVVKLDRASEYHEYHSKLSVDQVLKPNDTILKPFRLSLVNGYAKSQETFNQNGRIKEMKIFKNNDYVNTVLLKDTPLIQEFELDIVFTRNDSIKLKPVSYYKGSKYDDVCISEMQTNLGQTGLQDLNQRFNLNELLYGQ